MEEHRQRLLRLSMRRGVFPLARMYHEAAIEQEAKLRAQLCKGTDTFTTHQMRFALAQITDGQATLSQKMAAELGTVTREAQKEAVSGLLKDVARLEKEFTGATIELPLEEASRFYGIIDKRKTSLLRMHQSSMAKHGAQTVKAVERELAMSLLTGENQDQAIARVLPAIEGEWWQAERIVRTECLSGDTPVSGAAVQAVHRRPYEGAVIEIVSKDGRKFTATPNHPMLTRRGWVSAGNLRQSDYLVCYVGDKQAGSSRHENIAARPTTLAEIFNTVSAVGVRERRRTVQPDFHGDRKSVV